MELPHLGTCLELFLGGCYNKVVNSFSHIPLQGGGKPEYSCLLQPYKAGREFEKTPTLRPLCAVPRGITSDFGGRGVGGREGCAGVSSAVLAPLAVVQKIRAMDVPLTGLGLRWTYKRAVTQLVIPGVSSKHWEVISKT